jgi:hypothetical protein
MIVARSVWIARLTSAVHPSTEFSIGEWGGKKLKFPPNISHRVDDMNVFQGNEHHLEGLMEDRDSNLR